jgi:hypothetical protein
MKLRPSVMTPLLFAATFAGAILTPAAHAAIVIGEPTAPSMDGIPYDEQVEKELVRLVDSLSFYSKVGATNEMYYIPPFRAVDGIAGSLLVNKKQIERQGKAEELEFEYWDEQDDFYKDQKSQLEKLRSQYSSVITKLQNLTAEQEFLRPTLTALAEQLKKDADVAKQGMSSVDAITPDGVTQMYADRFAFVINSANIRTDDLNLRKSDDRGKALGRLNGSNGGNLAINLVAGLSEGQLTAVQKYKALRKQHGLSEIKFLKLPLVEATWTPLAETYKADKDGIPVYRNIAGGGSLEGASLSVDLTVDGASSLSAGIPPVVVPVQIKGKVYETTPPFEVSVDCNFTTGWFFKGRTDVRDGLIIYNNDIKQDIVSDVLSETEKPCTMISTGGGALSQEAREAALRASADQILQNLSNLFLERSNMARADQAAYFNSVQKSIEQNRHTGANKKKGGWFSAISSYATGGWTGLAIGLTSQASNFYWHTDSRNVRVTDTIRFSLKIKEQGNTVTTRDFPTNICIAWKPDAKAFVRCTDEQAAKSMTISEAGDYAKKSPECKDADDALECGKKREEVAPREPSNGTITLPDEI